MNRRELLGIAALTGIGISLGSKPLIAANSKLFPCRLKPGDKVGIIAPGSAVSDPMDLFRADEIIKALGLIAVYGRNVSKGSGYKTRTKEERIEDLHDMFSKNEIKAVFAIRGGYGTMDLLDAIEYDLIKENPKTFLGFSDITALHLAITQKSGLVTFHGPVMLSTFSEYSLQSLKKMLFEDTKDIFLMNPLRGDAIRNPYPVFTINEGKAEGELIGGNLSLISALMGTPYEIDTKNKILILEDTGEAPYRIHRMLNQMRLGGKLDNTAGIIFGRCDDCSSGQQGSMWDHSLLEALEDIFKQVDKPCFYGLLTGHTKDMLTWPYSVMSGLDADNGELKILESATIRVD